MVVILSLLATMVMPNILNRPEKARQQRAAIDIANIKTALGLFRTDTGRFPTTSEGLEALVTDPGIDKWDPDGYLEKLPLDPWGKPYVYLSPGINNKDYDLESFGKDGARWRDRLRCGYRELEFGIA